MLRKKLAELIIGRESKNPERQNILWNMAGSFLYAFASMLLTIAVVQIAGEDAGGIFTFAFTTFGQHLFMMAYFGIRPFQITDTEKKYTFGEYQGLRLYTCAAAILVGLIYSFCGGFSAEKGAVIFLMVVYKVTDALADTYEAEFQRSGRLYLTGKSNAFRTILSVAVFLSVLSATKKLVIASVWAAAAQIAGFFIMDVLVIRELTNIDWMVRAGKRFRLFKDNSLLFLSAVLDFYIFSASKYAIEHCMADRDMAVYGAIFMPTSVINLVAGFVIRPYLTKLSLEWEMGRTGRFVRLAGRLAGVISVLSVLAVGGAYIIGIPVLSLLYPNLKYMLKDCRTALVLIILGGALNAYMSLFYYALIIMKKQKYIFSVYGLVGITAILISDPFVMRGGITGGAMAYVLLTAMLMVCFGVIGAFGIREKAEKRKHEN